MSDSLDERELQLLERLAAILASLDQRGEVLERLMDLFLAAMGAERGLLLSFGPAGEARPLVVRNFSRETVAGMTAGWSRRAVEEMTGAGEIVVSEDVLHDRRFRDSDSVVDHDIQSLLCVPIRSGGALKGAVYVDHRGGSRSFTERDITFARALAELSGVALERSETLHALSEENTALKARAERYELGDVIGASRPMQSVFERLHKALSAPPEFTILLTGENGTGKTAVAQLLHRQGKRRDRPFITFGAGSVPETLIESELFGHKRGSFTGADSDKLGLIARAEGGTLFLDDIDAMPTTVQPKLLSFLQDREYRRIGDQARRADVCIICATNANLEALVAAGKFREDLFYRVNGIPIEVPPLRERKEDIPLLAQHFLGKYMAAVAKELRGFSPQALGQMVAYRWPGNVRELISEIVHGITMTQGPYIEAGDFKAADLRNLPRGAAPPTELHLETALNATTQQILRMALSEHNGNVSRAAKAAGVSRGKFYDLMGKVGLDSDDARRRSRGGGGAQDPAGAGRSDAGQGEGKDRVKSRTGAP